MKVVLFCGGLGTRLRENFETVPKPLAPVGPRPIIWHLMRYYAHYGFRDFILCLGYKSEMIKDYFLNYDPNLSRDLLLHGTGHRIEPAGSDIDDWTIRFVDTGLHSNIGQRLMAVRDFLQDDEHFLANYADQLSDLPLPEYLAAFRKSEALAGFVSVRPSQAFHRVVTDEAQLVTQMQPVSETDLWINGGYLVLNRQIFDYMESGDELVEAPFRRLVDEGRLFAWQYDGFWQAMDTLKDKMQLDRLYSQGQTPWRVWQR